MSTTSAAASAGIGKFKTNKKAAGNRLRLPAALFSKGQFWQHRTIAASAFAGHFPPIHRFGKLEVHKVHLRFPNLDSTKNSRHLLLLISSELPFWWETLKKSLTHTARCQACHCEAPQGAVAISRDHSGFLRIPGEYEIWCLRAPRRFAPWNDELPVFAGQSVPIWIFLTL